MKKVNGYLIVEDYELLSDYKKGRKEKEWLQIDGKKYLFKTGAINYENWAELFAVEFAKQCGLKTAEYDLAKWNGKIGLLTPNFLEENETLISGESFLHFYNTVLKENNLYKNVFEINSVESVTHAFSYFNLESNKAKVIDDLIYLWAYDGVLLESDRNSTNWSLITKNENYRLAPIYDSSTICKLNLNIKNLLQNASQYQNMNYIFTDVKQKFTLFQTDSKGSFFETFQIFCKKNPNKAAQVISRLNNIDVEKAICNLEERLNRNSTGKDITVPWEVQIWLDKVISFRMETLIQIYGEETNTNHHNRKR